MRALIAEKFSRPPPASAAKTADDLRDAAVLLPLIERETGITLLLSKRTEHLHHHPGQISLPGGIIETSDTNPTAAALRETHEEVGIPSDRVEVIGQMQTVATRTGFLITPVVGFVAPDVEFTLDPFEVECVIEVPLDFLLHSRNYKREARTFAPVGEISYYAIVYERHIIWGATAQIIVNFARHIGVTGIPD